MAQGHSAGGQGQLLTALCHLSSVSVSLQVLVLLPGKPFLGVASVHQMNDNLIGISTSPPHATSVTASNAYYLLDHPASS